MQACWLHRGLNGRIGGATPGKSLMGLRVVQCRNVTPVEHPNETGEFVLVSPGTDLGLPLAFGRSLVKNLILAFIFPICFAIFFFRYNRTGYDLLCSSIVVEDPYRNRNNNQNNRFRPQFWFLLRVDENIKMAVKMWVYIWEGNFCLYIFPKSSVYSRIASTTIFNEISVVKL